ncbi:hypothetical protein HRI_003185100 [Hibiscus trionum]|uniref:Reverse transcriptase domain-containing protein n=1 Tax=Hibiscus trionum TaxID=183268 RepID=A0A9W7IGY4_HIBTR|nr:hypothetical protein HRI_003185100 [Hibiscus trionum]
MKVFEDFYSGRDWETGVNHSFITLIPKKTSPLGLDDYRPISLVGGIYKIISNVLSRRLRPNMQTVVSKSQFAFILGRSILECVLIANEGIDYMNKLGAAGSVFKIDFKRAYDSVDWAFLLRVIKEMGFGDLWCQWILRCISTASISVLVNGSPTKSFTLSRGLRQGCSLSPLLFNLVGEALHLMLDKAILVGLFNGFLIGRGSNAYMLSHLQYADDLIIFCGACLGELLNVKRVLRVFEIASGLQLNLSKSRLFGVNKETKTVTVWASRVGCTIGHFPSEYLGLPLGPKRNSAILWEPVLEKFLKALSAWKVNCLSFSGRLVLIKSVLASLPIYYMSIFQIPSEVVKKMNNIMENFLWGASVSQRKIHWVKWSDVCLPFDKGGLNIRNLTIQNRAQLGKWFWNFANSRNSEWRKILCCKLNWDEKSMFPVDSNHRLMSWVWKGTSNTFMKNDDVGNVLRDQIDIQVGDGARVRFWSDLWIGDAPLMVNFPRIYALSQNRTGTVADFGIISDGCWVWQIQLRREPFDWEKGQ